MSHRISIHNKMLTVSYESELGPVSKTLCTDCVDISQWNVMSVSYSSDNTISVLINSKLSKFRLEQWDNTREITVFIGGLPSSLNVSYHQYHGYFKDVNLFGCNILSDYDDIIKSDRILVSNVDIIPVADHAIIDTLDLYQTVTVNSSDIKFPLLQSSFTNFTLSFEFKSPENILLFLSFQMKQYYFSLRKDYKQLILELNLHGPTEPLIVELSSISEWTKVEVTISDEQTILSTSNQKNEVKTRSPVAHKRFERRPLFFGYSESIGYGFRGCLRNFVLNGRSFPLYDTVLSNKDTLVGCHYPTPSCDHLTCPFSCTQTWDETKCVSGEFMYYSY